MPFVAAAPALMRAAPEPVGDAATLAARLPGADGVTRAGLFVALAALDTPEAAHEVAACLTSPHAALRNEAILTLQAMGTTAEAAIDALLANAEPGPRLLAIEVTRAWPPARALPRLARLLEHDPHPNVCAAALDVAADTGTPELLPAIAAARARFRPLAFVVFAADITRARLTGAP